MKISNVLMLFKNIFISFLPQMCRMSEESFWHPVALLHEIQDQDLTRSFLSKIGGDLTSCSLNWEVLQYLLQQASAQTITVNLRKNCFLQESITRLLPFLDRIVFKRLSNSFSPFIGHEHKVVFLFNNVYMFCYGSCFIISLFIV